MWKNNKIKWRTVGLYSCSKLMAQTKWESPMLKFHITLAVYLRIWGTGYWGAKFPNRPVLSGLMRKYSLPCFNVYKKNNFKMTISLFLS